MRNIAGQKLSTDRVDIKGLDKAAILAALWNNARQFFENPSAPQREKDGDMSIEEARQVIESKIACRDGILEYNIGGLYGRTIKTDLSGDTMDPRSYDYDSGFGKAEEVIGVLRETGDISVITSVSLPSVNLEDS